MNEVLICNDCGHGRREEDIHLRDSIVSEVCEVRADGEYIEVVDGDTEDITGYRCGNCNSSNMNWEEV